MSKQVEQLEKQLAELGPGNDTPIIINYVDGESIEIPSYRKLLEEQLELHKLADKYIDEMFSKEL